MKQVSVGHLKNGLPYYTYFDSGVHLGGIGVKAGSVNDPPGKRGLAHLAEHCVFCGSHEFSPEVVDRAYYEKYMGGPDASANVRTYFTSTFYGHDTLLWRPHLMDCFDMFARIMKHPEIDARRVEIEKAAVHNEFFLNGNDSAAAHATDMARKLLYRKNPAGNRIDAELPEFESMRLQDVRNFIRRYNVPKNMFVVLFGPEHQKVRQICERYFDDWGASTEPTFGYDGSDNVPVLVTIRSDERIFPGMKQHHLVMAFPTEIYGSKDEEAIEILCRILAMRLRERLRGQNTDFNKGVYRVFVTPERSKYHGVIYVWFATVGGIDTVIEYEDAILDEMRKLGEVLVSNDEIEDIRKNLEWSYRMAFRNIPLELCELVVEAVANGDEDLVGLHSYLPNLEKVTRRKLREVARKYFVPFYARALIRPE